LKLYIAKNKWLIEAAKKLVRHITLAQKPYVLQSWLQLYYTIESITPIYIQNMGSYSWVRNDKRGGGKSYVAGSAAVVPPPSKKRKLVWQRDSNAQQAEQPKKSIVDESAAASAPSTSGTAMAPAARIGKTEAAAAQLAELETLRKKIEARREAIQEESNKVSAAKAAAAAADKAKEAEREARRVKLEAGFASAFASAKEAADADIAASKTAVTFANIDEVQRVLESPSDYAVLRLAPGADGVALRRRYREMAVQLHPDKCKVEGASDAFHRVVLAYQQLIKYAK